MGPSPFLPLPPTLSMDAVEQQDQAVLVSLRATAPAAACPTCGTFGSRVHSRYTRTIADLACGGQRVVLKLLVRKWVCASATCSQHLFAESFPGLVQRYARMTDRLRTALQVVGVTTNGADGARLVSALAMPTTGKTIIRCVLQLPLPPDAPVRVVGVDEWAWKKGSHYGTILVDLEHRRVVALLSDRSVETSATWFTKHPEVEWVSRDRGKLFREAAARGAPQARHIADRFHLQQNFAEALEGVFRPYESVLKAVTHQLAEATPAPSKAPAAQQAEQESRSRHATRVRRHKRIWKLFRAGHRIESIAQLVGIGSRSVYRALEHEQPPARQRRPHRHHLTDPYQSALAQRWNEGCHEPAQLYQEAVALGYPGSLRSIERLMQGWRPGRPAKLITHGLAQGKPPSPRNVALMMVRPADHRTKEQAAFLKLLCQKQTTIATVFTLTQEFGQLLRLRQGVQALERWKAAVQQTGIKALTRFVEGLADDAEAVANACTESWSNGMVEGFNHKVKLLKRSSYGQAGFPLLQRRVLLHPAHASALCPETMLYSS